MLPHYTGTTGMCVYIKVCVYMYTYTYNTALKKLCPGKPDVVAHTYVLRTPAKAGGFP